MLRTQNPVQSPRNLAHRMAEPNTHNVISVQFMNSTRSSSVDTVAWPVGHLYFHHYELQTIFLYFWNQRFVSFRQRHSHHSSGPSHPIVHHTIKSFFTTLIIRHTFTVSLER